MGARSPINAQTMILTVGYSRSGHEERLIHRSMSLPSILSQE